jgi:hypothetical protein
MGSMDASLKPRRMRVTGMAPEDLDALREELGDLNEKNEVTAH